VEDGQSPKTQEINFQDAEFKKAFVIELGRDHIFGALGQRHVIGDGLALSPWERSRSPPHGPGVAFEPLQLLRDVQQLLHFLGAFYKAL